MMPSSPDYSWSRLRRELLLGALCLGALSLFCVVWGRPGDAEAGAIGGVIGGLIAAIVVAVELIGRGLARILTRSGSEQPSPDSQEDKPA